MLTAIVKKLSESGQGQLMLSSFWTRVPAIKVKRVKESTKDRREWHVLAGMKETHDALMNKTVEERLVI